MKYNIERLAASLQAFVGNKERTMCTFSKSKLLSLRQCPKRLWLEVHRPNLRIDSATTKANFQVGSQVGEVARQIYDPEGCGASIDMKSEGVKRACEHSAELLHSTKPIFEAGFSANGALAFADVMLPKKKDGRWVWHMVEVKSSTRVKDYHHDDVAVQTFVALSSGVSLESIALAHIDSSWVYQGDEDYQGLLIEKDLTAEAFARTEEVKDWIDQAQSITAESSEPTIETGSHCRIP